MKAVFAGKHPKQRGFQNAFVQRAKPKPLQLRQQITSKRIFVVGRGATLYAAAQGIQPILRQLTKGRFFGRKNALAALRPALNECLPHLPIGLSVYIAQFSLSLRGAPLDVAPFPSAVFALANVFAKIGRASCRERV